ncbi:Uncharacterized protein HZ326_28437, partial [Fusarium oxysporum f. sp. albedinis]
MLSRPRQEHDAVQRSAPRQLYVQAIRVALARDRLAI